MAILTYPTILCAALFVAVVAMPSRGDAASDVAQAAAAPTVLIDADVGFQGRWVSLRGSLAVHAGRWIPQWNAELSTLGIRAGIAHDAAGLSTVFDVGGWLPTQGTDVLKSLLRVR